MQSVSSRDLNEVIPVALKSTSIPFWKCNERKIKEKDHVNHILQSQISHSASVDLWPLKNLISGATEVQLMQTQFYWIPYLKTYQRSKVQPKPMSYKGDMSFQR